MPACPSCGVDNPERARFCWSCGAALAGAPELRIAEERKIVSVLFVDLVGFTAASENADPEDVRARLRPYYARVKSEIEQLGGTVEKFVGDAVMAVFGAPLAREDDAERAVSAGLRVLDAIDELNAQNPALRLAVRGAVNTGEAIVTLGTGPVEGEGIVAGDVVNTAARLQQAAPPGGVAVGETTYRATRDAFEYEALTPVTAKGKSQPLGVWRVTGARARSARDLEPAPRAPLIGRDDEQALLRATFARAVRENATQFVTITGEPGIGKSRLVQELRAWVDDQPERVVWRQGRSLSYGEGITCWAFGEIVKAHAGILESDAPRVAASKLDAAVAEAVEDPEERNWVVSGLAPLVGAGEGSPGERAEGFAAWRRFVEGIASQRPLVLVFEDLHWADDTLLAFVEHLVDWATDVPLLVLCTARPELYERHPGWGGGKRNSNTIALSPLGLDDTTRLVAALLRRALLPAETQARLLEHAGGNPLYAEEFVRMLEDRGVLGHVGELRDAEIPVPDTVQSLIAARLDTLAPARKALLQDAAVVGKVFWAGALASMGNVDEGVVRNALHELARKELVRTLRRSSVHEQAEYAFWHVIVREVAYGQIPRAVRAAKHVAAAEWVEAMTAERLTDHAELLAHHYEQALELGRAAGGATDERRVAHSARRFLELAGDRALSLDLAKAAAYYRRAHALYGADELERAGVLVKAALVDPDTLDEAEQELDDALGIYRSVGDELRQGWVLVHLAQYAHSRGEGSRGEQLLSQAIDLLERHPPGEELVAAYTRQAAVFATGGRSRECLEVSELALGVVEQLGLERYEGRLRQYRGIARCELGYPEGLADLRAALELAHESGELVTACFAYSNLGTFTLTRSAREAADIYTEGVEFGERRGMAGSLMWLRAERTWTFYDLGRWDELLEEVAAVDKWSRGRGPSYHSIIALPQKGLVLVQRGRVEEAARLVGDYLPRARAAKDPQVLMPALAAAALAATAQGELDEAVALVREAEASTHGLTTWQRSRYLPELASVAVAADALDAVDELLAIESPMGGRPAHALTAARAVAAEARLETELALALHEEAAAGWHEQGSVPGRAASLLGAGRCLLALGRGDEANASLREARDLFIRLGATPSVGVADDLLGRATSLSA